MPVESFEDGNGFDVRDGKRWNARDSTVDRLTRYTRLRWVSGSCGISRSNAQKLDAASLDTARVTCGPIWIELVAIRLGNFSIITRVAVDDNTNCAELLSTLDL